MPTNALLAAGYSRAEPCLKKCFFETYRFSEDLDFTLTDESQLDEAFLKDVFADVGEWIYERSGLEIPAARQDFDIYDNPRGKKKLCRQDRLSRTGFPDSQRLAKNQARSDGR
jgi:predicted nucleotidyltransferase component of viral defense system